MKIENAIIESFSINMNEGYLTLWLDLSLGSGGGQGFGGYLLFKESEDFDKSKNYAGLWIHGVLKAAGVTDVKNLKGRAIRIKKESFMSKIDSIGHITKDEWFDPEAFN